MSAETATNGIDLSVVPTDLAEREIGMTGQAINFYNRAMGELENHLTKGEEAAKTAVLLGLVVRANVILVGEPAEGKSDLANNYLYMIDGVDPRDQATVPHLAGQHDIQAKELVGGEVVQKIREDGEEYERVTTIEAAVTPAAKSLRLEEPNRMPQHALQSLLPALENRWLETTAGRVPLPELRSVVATMNPSESKQSTFRLSDAMASRFSIGAVMATPRHDEQARRERLEAIDDFELTPEDMKKLADGEFLDKLREHVLSTAEPADVKDRRIELTMRTADTLREEANIREGDARYLKHIQKISRALGGLRNAEHVVKEGDVDDAVLFVIAARLGALTTLDSAEIGEIHDSITLS